MRFLIQKLLTLTAFALPAFAAAENAQTAPADSSAPKAITDSANYFQRFSAVPVLGYTE